MLLLAALVVAAAVVWAGWRISTVLASRKDGSEIPLRLMALFAAGLSASADDPRALLTWQPLAATARRLFPADFVAIDQAWGSSFPFSAERIQAAHDRWTTEWLAWERTHDAEFKLKAVVLQQELGEGAATTFGRARLEAVERQKLDGYQRRYEEYTRVARALHALLPPKA